ncbi:MAG: hypothetical protein WCK89_18715, partial [bacterium]
MRWPLRSYPYDQSAAIRALNSMAVRQSGQVRHDANSVKSTTPIKFATTTQRIHRRPPADQTFEKLERISNDEVVRGQRMTNRMAGYSRLSRTWILDIP